MSAPSAGRWLALVTTLPVDAAARMNALRTLESLGAAALREGVYLLPDSDARRASCERLAAYIRAGTGAAELLDIVPRDPAQEAEFRRRFDHDARYVEVGKTVTSLKNAFGLADPSALARVVQRQRDEFERIAAVDFFDSREKEHVAQLLDAADAAVHALLFPSEPSTTPRDPSRRAYFQRVWATRTPLQVDRLASAWLIRRFIDAEAQLVFLDKTAAPAEHMVSYGYDDAEFSNTRTQVTFESLLDFFRLEHDAALCRVGQLVKALASGDVTVAEANGIEAMLRSAEQRATDNNERCAESEKTFDLIYERYA